MTYATHQPEYRIWQAMKYRCLNPQSKDFHLYGGRGITICAEWQRSYSNFIRDMGRRPTTKHMIDRIDNNGPYSPRNCQWSTSKQQARNKRSNHRVSVNGRSVPLVQAQELTGIADSTIRQRINLLGWTEHDATTRAVRPICYIEVDGASVPLERAAKMVGLAPTTLRNRIRQGWPLSAALTMTPRKGQRPPR